MTPTIELIFVAIAPFAISLMNPFPKRSVRRLLTAPVRRPVPVFCSAVSIIRITDKALRDELVTLTGGQKTRSASGGVLGVLCRL
ncbi:nitroreductase NfsA [Escherichia coli]|uniref:Nitroreductase NfsA n=1 Tax=Escherichia coli TaxID=562 RepID=A0A377DKY3_ECOLX|nr:nitroreductase NfsA [Escherichia coli]